MPLWTARTRTSPSLRPAICSPNTCTCRLTKSFMPTARSTSPALRMTLMTLLIRDVCRAGFPGRMPLASMRGAHYFFPIVLLLIAGSCMAVAAPPQSQDPSAKPALVPIAQQSSTPVSNPSPHPSTEQTPLQKAVHQKKVITEDDLAKPAKVISLSDLEGEENNPTCELSCEAELRDQLGFGA